MTMIEQTVINAIHNNILLNNTFITFLWRAVIGGDDRANRSWDVPSCPQGTGRASFSRLPRPPERRDPRAQQK